MLNQYLKVHHKALPVEKKMHARWSQLGTTAQELTLDFTLPTGQSFRWRQTQPHEYTGVIGDRLVRLQQEQGSDVRYQVLARVPGSDPALDAEAIREYFNMPRIGDAGQVTGVSLAELSRSWRQACQRFAAVHPSFPGARVLRQDPVECLFSFICSSNNHITRIQGMVETLCSAYGTPLNPATHPCDTIKGEVAEDTPLPAQPLLLIKQEAPGGDTLCCAPVPPKGAPLPVGGCCQGPGQAHPGRPDGEQGQAGRAEPGEAQGMGGAGGAGGEVEAQQGEGWPLCTPEVKEENEDSGRQEEREAAHTGFYAFPSLKQLERATEEELRAAGFGYRAKFIVGTVRELSLKPEGGEAWLAALRNAPLEVAIQSLTTLPGVGPKVAACVALFSLDKHASIPVDTHVWQIACTYYLPDLKTKTLTPKLHATVAKAFYDRFGDYCGWAHNTMFISQLASQQHHLPAALRKAAAKGGKRRNAAGSDSEAEPLSGASSEGSEKSPKARTMSKARTPVKKRSTSC